jgi:hypothetical protein
MAFIDSVAGNFTSRLWANPLTGGAAVFAAGAGLFAGAETYATTEGSAGTRADAGATSALQYGTAGLLTAGGAAAVGSVMARQRARADGYRGAYNEEVGYGAAQFSKDFSKAAPKYAADTSSAIRDYGKGLFDEIRSPGGWKTALQRPSISGGLGALVGGYVGHRTTDGSTAGTVVAAAVGTGVGIAAGRAFKASEVWGKWGGGTRLGAIVAASAVIGGAIKVLHGNGDPERVDRAAPEDNGFSDSGVRDRMGRIGAGGDLVFGLHKAR